MHTGTCDLTGNFNSNFALSSMNNRKICVSKNIIVIFSTAKSPKTKRIFGYRNSAINKFRRLMIQLHQMTSSSQFLGEFLEFQQKML